jgi:thiol-disulfide isomerase/thioredoxin
MLRPPLVLCAVLLACSAEPAATPSAAPPPPTATPHKSTPPRLIPAPRGGRVAEVVEAERGSAGGAPLVVYVGAGWCEPCVAFHEALVAGQLDADLPDVRFLEFDLDRDRARLAADGYSSRYVPLFALPGADGRASGAQIEGGTKGPGAARQLVQRLRPLLTAGSAAP